MVQTQRAGVDVCRDQIWTRRRDVSAIDRPPLQAKLRTGDGDPPPLKPPFRIAAHFVAAACVDEVGGVAALGSLPSLGKWSNRDELSCEVASRHRIAGHDCAHLGEYGASLRPDPLLPQIGRGPKFGEVPLYALAKEARCIALTRAPQFSTGGLLVLYSSMKEVRLIAVSRAPQFSTGKHSVPYASLKEERCIAAASGWWRGGQVSTKPSPSSATVPYAAAKESRFIAVPTSDKALLSPPSGAGSFSVAL